MSYIDWLFIFSWTCKSFCMIDELLQNISIESHSLSLSPCPIWILQFRRVFSIYSTRKWTQEHHGSYDRKSAFECHSIWNFGVVNSWNLFDCLRLTGFDLSCHPYIILHPLVLISRHSACWLSCFVSWKYLNVWMSQASNIHLWTTFETFERAWERALFLFI